MLKTSVFALALCLGAHAASASDNWNLEARAGTLGLGIDASYKVNDSLALRGGPNVLKFDRSETIDGVEYEAEVDFLNVGALVDWHPFKSGFRITGGAFFGGNDLSLNATPANNVTIGDTSFTPAQVGTIDGEVEWNAVTPYVGIGYSNAFYSKRKWRFSVDLGAKYNGEADVSYRTNGSLAGTPGFEAEVQREIENIEDDLDDFQFYPVLMVGVSYRF